MNKNKEIIMKFTDYKQLESEELSFKNSYLYILNGKNGAGKTGVKCAIETLQTAHSTIDDPITHGKDSLSVEGINFPGIDGRLYICQWNFDGIKNKFVVIDDEGKKISSPEKIRDIFKFKNITVENFLAQSLNAKGREEQKKLFMSFLTDEEQKKHTYLKTKEKEAYDARTKAKTELEYLVGVCTDSKITKDEQELISNSEKATTTFTELETQIKSFDDIRATKDIKDKRRKEVSESIVTLNNEIVDMFAQIEVLKGKIADKTIAKKTLEEEFKTFKADIIDEEKEKTIRERYEKGKVFMESIKTAKTKKEKFDDNDTKRNAKLIEWNTLDGNVKKYRGDADAIIKNSKMPIKDVEFEDDGIKIHGLSLKENQISKGDTMVILAEILCILNEAPMMLIGSVGDLDKDNKKAMEALAIKYNKILIADQVDDDNPNIHVVGFDETNK